MQDDLTDGINYLAAQGIIDKDRVCIVGGSYGGYAVMMGLAKDPDLYRCGINLYGVTDPMLLYTTTWSDTSGSDAEKFTMPVMLGDPVKDAALLKAASPLHNAAKITKPVFMAYGGKDVRVPLIHGEKMRDSLKGKIAVEWVVYPDEGHGWNKTANNVDFWTRAENFLNKNTAPK
jgi:dipeptidyl aminopeptidase/acylaminoacyl peptidase